MSAPHQIILGISAYYHDSAAALMVDGELVAAAEEERFTRVKHTADFPIHAIQYCLKAGGVKMLEVDSLVFYDKPLLKFERILETTYLNAPFGFRLFHKSMPVWMKGKLNLRKTIIKALQTITGGVKFDRNKILFTTHHLAHAASAFYPSPFQEAAILTIDGVGEWATATIGVGKGKNIELIKQMNFPHSVGLLYSSFTYFLGFKVNSGEYKLMGLSPYGDPKSDETKGFIESIRQNLITVFPDGSIQMNDHYFAYHRSLKMIQVKRWEALFGLTLRKPEEKLNQSHANLALAIQLLTEDIVLKLAKTTRELTGQSNLVLAGGVALNGVANGKLLKTNLFENCWIQPAAGDSGGALGAAYLGHYLLNQESERTASKLEEDAMQNGFLGPAVDLEELRTFVEGNDDYEVTAFSNENDLYETVADVVINNHLIGWVKGRMEFGPRALGARSIIASPLSKSNQSRINQKVKFREDFRPFAPVMLKEEAARLYDFEQASSYMQYVCPILPEFRKTVPENFGQMSVQEKVNIPTSVLEAVTHVDFSSRLQVVKQKGHPFYPLLEKLKEKTGYGVLLNTSFNTGGEPIVQSLNDIFDCFKTTDLDYLVVENTLVQKLK